VGVYRWLWVWVLSNWFVYIQVEKVLVVRVSAGLKEWTRCLLGVVDESVDNTDAPVGHKPGGDPVLEVMMKNIVLSLLLWYCISLLGWS